MKTEFTEKNSRIMSNQKQGYSRYLVVRGHGIFWQGDPSSGGRFRELFITSDQWSSMAGIFQVYGIEGKSSGLDGGFVSVLEEGKKLIFEGDFAGFDAADAKYKELIADAIKDRFIKKSKLP